MKIVGLLCVYMALQVVGCSQNSITRDPVTEIESDDPEMIAAIEQARKTLPEFWKACENPAPGTSNFSLKIRIVDPVVPEDEEYFWITNVSRNETRVAGVIGNEPEIVHTVRYGQRIEVPETDVSDWLFVRNGKMVGNATVRPLMKKMSADEVEKVKMMLETP